VYSQECNLLNVLGWNFLLLAVVKMSEIVIFIIIIIIAVLSIGRSYY